MISQYDNKLLKFKDIKSNFLYITNVVISYKYIGTWLLYAHYIHVGYTLYYAIFNALNR